MNHFPKTAGILLVIMVACTVVQAQNKNAGKAAVADTSSPKEVTITSAFKPSLKNAAKINFTAATPVIDSSKIPVTYTIPSQNLFFSFHPVAIKPLALTIDSGKVWENNQYVKLGAGNFSSFLGEAAFSFGDGKHAITNIRGNFITATGHLPAQQANRGGIDVLSVFNTANTNEWTTHAYYQINTQYLYGYQPSSLVYTKDELLQRFNTVGIEAGMQNKLANSFGITYHPQVSLIRFSDNQGDGENNLIIKAPISKAFGKSYSFDVGLAADISAINLPVTSNPSSLTNNLYSVNPSIQFHTPDLKIKAGIQPSWDNNNFAMLPDISFEARIKDANVSVEAGWVGSFVKNTYRSLAAINPWIAAPWMGTLNNLMNTQVNEQYAGVKGSSGDHLTYEARISFLRLNNQPLFVNDLNDGKTFIVLFEPQMLAQRLHAEIGYTLAEDISLLASATYTQYNSLKVNEKPWGLLPFEMTGTLKWKILKDLQFKADAFIWDGSQYRTKSLQAAKSDAVADINAGVEFTVMPRVNLWLQMNNVLNTAYQRWNQYPGLGFTVLGGIVYSFK